MAEGWISIHRQIFEHRYWTGEAFSRGQAWIDLLLLANHKPGSVRKRGIQIGVARGQVGMSIKGLAIRWHWSRGKVRRFLEDLKNGHEIEHQINKVTCVITILNYNKYQEGGHQYGHQTDIKRTSNGHQTDTNNNVNKVNNENNENKEPPKPPTGGLAHGAEKVFDEWNVIASSRKPLSTCRKLTTNRLKKIHARLADAGWLDDFREAIKGLPLGGGGKWQPDLDWLIANDTNVYRLLEGAFDWRTADDPAMLKLARQRRRAASQEREQLLLQQKEEQKTSAKQTSEAIRNILAPKDGGEGGPQGSSLLYG